MEVSTRKTDTPYEGVKAGADVLDIVNDGVGPGLQKKVPQLMRIHTVSTA